MKILDLKKFFNRSSILGLDIGSHSIKLVELKRTGDKPVITCAKSVQIPHESSEETDGNVPGSAVVSPYTVLDEFLREFLSGLELQTKRVVTAVSAALEEQVTIISDFFIPDLRAELPKEAIKANVMTEAEVQARMPFPADVAVTDCNILREKTEGEKGLETFFVAAHKDLIDYQYQLLRSVGLMPVAVDVDFLAIARLLGFTNQVPDEEDVAILDIGASKTSVGFYQHGKLHIYPPVAYAGEHLTADLSQQLSISWEEAEELKKNVELQSSVEPLSSPDNSAASVDAGNVRQTVSLSNSPDSVDADNVGQTVSLSNEAGEVIQRSLEWGQGLYPQLQSRLDFYEADYPDFRLSKIFSAAGTSQLSNLDKFLESRLFIPVENVSYLDDIPLDPKGDVSEIEGNEPLFATAVGLALKQNL